MDKLINKLISYASFGTVQFYRLNGFFIEIYSVFVSVHN